jgi:hypothetical protein
MVNERVYEAKNYAKDTVHFKIEANSIDTKFYFAGHCVHTIPEALGANPHQFNSGRFMFVGDNRWISNVQAK